MTQLFGGHCKAKSGTCSSKTEAREALKSPVVATDEPSKEESAESSKTRRQKGGVWGQGSSNYGGGFRVCNFRVVRLMVNVNSVGFQVYSSVAP